MSTADKMLMITHERTYQLQFPTNFEPPANFFITYADPHEAKNLDEVFDFVYVQNIFDHWGMDEILDYLQTIWHLFTKNLFVYGKNLPTPQLSNYDFSYTLTDSGGGSFYKFYKHEASHPLKPFPIIKDYVHSPLNLMYIMTFDGQCGGLKMMYEQMKELQKRGHFITVVLAIVYKEVTTIPDWVEDFVPDKLIVSIKNLRSQLEGVDLIIGEDFGTVEHELRHVPVPFFCWEQGSSLLFGDFAENNQEEFSSRNSFKNRLQDRAYLATVSQYARQVIRSRFQTDSVIMYPWLDSRHYYPKTKGCGDLLTVLLVGNPYNKFKGFDKALHVLVELWEQGLRFKVEWVCHYLPQTGKLPFEIRVYQGQSQEAIGNVYRGADILLSCSHYESFALPPLEAMACGVAVVATDNGGINEYGIHNQNVLLSKSHTVKELAQMLEMLLTDADLRKRLVLAGYETAARYTQASAIDRVEDVIFSIVADNQNHLQNFETAQNLWRAKRYEKAIAHYEKFLSHEAGSQADKVTACLNMSKCHKALGDTPKVLDSLLKAFQYISVPTAELCAELGHYYSSVKDQSGAIHWYNQALETAELCHEELYRIHIDMMLAYYQLDKVDKSFQHHLEAKRLYPKDDTVRENDSFFTGLGYR